MESADWAWKLTSDSAALEITVKKGKYLKAGVLRAGKAPGTFVFETTLADGTSRTFAGAAGDRNRLALTADAKAPAGGVRRVSITPLHDTRLLVLLEAEDPERHTFSRLGEVGYTREGVAFAAGESYPLCVVTEGRGTIQVSYKGKTYWVCCSGCRDLFQDDPQSVLADPAAGEGQGEKITPGFRSQRRLPASVRRHPCARQRCSHVRRNRPLTGTPQQGLDGKEVPDAMPGHRLRCLMRVCNP